MLKFVLLIAALAYTSAGYAGKEQTVSYVVPAAAHYSSAPAVSYNTFNRHQYAAPVHQRYAHVAPFLGVPSHTYVTEPLAHSYAAPAVSYGRNYAPALSHDNYGYSAYATPLAAKIYAVAQPQFYHQNVYATQAVAAPVLASRGYNYAPVSTGAQLLGYNKHHGHYAH